MECTFKKLLSHVDYHDLRDLKGKKENCSYFKSAE